MCIRDSYTIGTTGTTPTAASTKYTSAGIPVPTTVGTYTIEAIAVELGYTTSAVASATYTVSSIPPDFTFDISPKNLTITAGQSGTLTATITPLHGFDSKIVFSCSGLPNGATCPCLLYTSRISDSGLAPQAAAKAESLRLRSGSSQGA